MKNNSTIIKLEQLMRKYDETLLADEDGNYKSRNDALNTMSKVWNRMNNEDKKELSHGVAGLKDIGEFSACMDEISK